jgi:hypothetical protein
MRLTRGYRGLRPLARFSPPFDLSRRPSARQHEAHEAGAKLGEGEERENIGDVLVRPHDHHAPLPPIDAPQVECVVAA